MAFFKKRKFNDGGEGPKEDENAEAKNLLKNLAKKQLTTNVSLNDIKNMKKDFNSSASISITSLTSGSSSVQEFSEAQNKIEKLEYYYAAGLSDADINLLLLDDAGKAFSERKNIQEDVLKRQVSELRKAIQLKETASSNLTATRNIKDEIDLSYKPTSAETNLLKFSIGCRKEESNEKYFPTEELKEIANDLTQSERIPSLKTRRRIFRKLESPQLIAQKQNVPGKSKWDLKVPKSDVPQREYTVEEFKPKQYYTIKDNKIVKIDSPTATTVPSDNIDTSEIFERISEQQIRNDEKFKNFDKGQPSKTLFVKNIARKTTEPYFSSILSKVASNVQYDLQFRKRGQAFIHCKSTTDANTLMESLLGLVLNGRPLIVEFGKNNPD